MSETVFITAPAGNIGGAAAARVAAAGEPLSVLALEGDVARLDPQVRDRAQVHVGTLDLQHDVVAAGQGAAAMLLILPPVVHVDDPLGVTELHAANALAAIEAHGIQHVVFISTQGAGSSRAAIVAASYALEARLRDAAPHVRALRPGPLMENFLQEIEPIAEGVFPFVAGPQTPMHLIAAADVGAVAAELLLDRSWSGFASVELRGPTLPTPVDVAAQLSAQVGREIAYVQITADELVTEMVKVGIAPGAARAITEVMHEARDEVYPDGPTTRVMPTDLETFLRTRLVPLLAAQPA